MEEECVIVEETSGTTPPQKKLKQGRLPFTPLQGKSPQTVGKQLKRKLSSSDLDCKSPKTPRSESEAIPKNGNQDESALAGTQDSKVEEVSMKDTEELENKDKNEAVTDEKNDGVKENVKKRGRSAASKNNTPAKATPAKATPAKATPAKATPAKATPAKATPAKATPGKVTPAKATPGKVTPAKATPAKSTPAKSTPSKELQIEKENKEKDNEEIVNNSEKVAKKRGRPSVAGNKTPVTKKTPVAKTPGAKTPGTKTPGAITPKAKTPGKTPGKPTLTDKNMAEPKVDKSVKQEEKQEEKTANKGKDNSSENKTPGKNSKKLDKFAEKDSSEKTLEIKGDEKKNSIEEKSVQILDDAVQESKDQSKKRKASDDISNSTTTEMTAKESNEIKKETEKEPSVKKRSRNSLDAFVKKGAEAMAIIEKQTKNRNETASKDEILEGDTKGESEKITKPQVRSESESEELTNSDSKTSPKGSQVAIPKKLTPGQLAKETERLKKKEEREKEKEERLKKKQQEIDEKNRIKEEERKKKEEEREKEKKQKEEEKKQKEEERQQKLKEKEQQKKELEKEKEEKKRMKQEEIDAKLKEKEDQRLKKEEEKKLQEEEERRQKEQAKAKFSSFFVAKKVVPSALPKEKKNDYFCQFQLKKDMRLAPVTRLQLPNLKKEHLDKYLSGNKKETIEKLFVKSIKLPEYSIGTSARTFPPQEKKEEENDCEVIEEEEDDDGIGEAVITSESVPKGKTTVRRKVLKFCENNRPPYCGTWRKKTKHITARRPFSKDEDFFNYEYDSDEDWEEEATGESLSDCEDEKDMDEDGKPETAENDYEVDNDFFVPHGYLSDDEGKSDQEEMENEMEVDNEKDTNKKKEQLKQKQTDFENEIKQKTRQLKPRVFGCLWLSEEDTNKAFDQLLKVLNPHRAVVCCSSKLPIATTYSKVKPKDTSKEVNESNQDGDDAAGASKKEDKYAKNFPEEGVPALIKLLHCNINSKKFIGKEYCEFWKKNSEEGVEDSMASRHGLLAKVKIDTKVSELGAIWGKNPADGDKAKQMMWTVPLEVREKYGLSDLSANTWTYILKPKERKTTEGTEDPSDDPKTPKINTKDAKTPKNNSKDAKTPKVTDSKTPKITAFAKKVSPGSSMNNLSKTPSGTSDGSGKNGSTPKTPKTPSEVTPSSTGSQKQLFSKITQKNTPVSTPPKTPKSAITNFFKKKVDKENPKEDEKLKQTEKIEKTEGTEKKDVITLD